MLRVQYLYLFHSHRLDVFILPPPPLVVNIETACQVFMFTFQTRHFKFGGKTKKQKKKEQVGEEKRRLFPEVLCILLISSF